MIFLLWLCCRDRSTATHKQMNVIKILLSLLGIFTPLFDSDSRERRGNKTSTGGGETEHDRQQRSSYRQPSGHLRNILEQPPVLTIAWAIKFVVMVGTNKKDRSAYLHEVSGLAREKLKEVKAARSARLYTNLWSGSGSFPMMLFMLSLWGVDVIKWI